MGNNADNKSDKNLDELLVEAEKVATEAFRILSQRGRILEQLGPAIVKGQEEANKQDE